VCRELFNADLSIVERTALLFDVVRSREFSNAGLVELSTAGRTASSDATSQLHPLYSVHYCVNLGHVLSTAEWTASSVAM
jgi:hypothetical protein